MIDLGKFPLHRLAVCSTSLHGLAIYRYSSHVNPIPAINDLGSLDYSRNICITNQRCGSTDLVHNDFSNGRYA
jgi:hypothetical protein